MTYRAGYRRRSTTAPRVGRWMDLRYAGSCSACRVALPAGTRAFYDPADRSVTCTDMACCEASGLTRQEWSGSPVSGSYVTVRSDTRLRPTVLVDGELVETVTRGAGFRRDGTYFGRCEDAPCCGCCD